MESAYSYPIIGFSLLHAYVMQEYMYESPVHLCIHFQRNVMEVKMQGNQEIRNKSEQSISIMDCNNNVPSLHSSNYFIY